MLPATQHVIGNYLNLHKYPIRFRFTIPAKFLDLYMNKPAKFF